MKLNYKQIGDFIELVDDRNKDLSIDLLLGLSISKEFIPSVANTVGANMANYKIIRKGQFACSIMQVRRDKKMPVALLQDFDEAIISQAYPVFQVKDEKRLLPEYLMMWFSRSEFDRHACFLAVGGVRGSLEWEDFLEMEFPLPSIEKQREIVAEYNTVVNRIKLNEKLNQKLEETAQALYKHWFVDFEFPVYNDDGTLSSAEGYNSSGGKMVFNDELEKEIPVGWSKGQLQDVAKITMGQSPSGESYNFEKNGEVFYQGRTDFGFRFPEIRMYTTEPKRRASKGDVLMSVRAPVGDVNIASTSCCIGRGISSIRHKTNQQSYLYYLMQDVRDLFDVSNDEGTIFGSITKDGLHEISVINPSNFLTELFDSITKPLDKRISILCQEVDSLSTLRTLILSKMTQVEPEKEIA